MKVELKNKINFNPIIITIQSKFELEELHSILSKTSKLFELYSELHKIMEVIK